MHLARLSAPRPSSRPLLRAAALVVVGPLLAVASCRADPPSSPTRAAPPPPLPVAWSVQAQPLEQPTAVAGLSVGVERRSSAPQLVARDPATGRIRWTVPIGPGYSPTGYGLGWAVAGTGAATRIALLRPTGVRREADLVIVRPSDGRQDVVPGRTVFDSTPSSCRGGDQICIRVPGGIRVDGTTAVRTAIVSPLDPRAGFRFGGSRPTDGLTPASGEDLFLDESAGEFQEALVRVVHGHTRWRRDLDAVFGDHSTGLYGSTFFRDGSLLWGSLSVGLTREHGRRVRVIDRQPMAGLDLRTGETLWQQRGVTTFCSPAYVDLSGPDEETDDTDRLQIRCRVSGTFVSRGGPELVELPSDPLRLSVEPFDPRTGESGDWSIAVTPASDFARIQRPLPLAGVAVVALPTADGMRVVDLRTGEQRPPAPGERFVCERRLDLRLPGDEVSRHVGELLRGCDARGRRLAGPFPADLVAAAVPRSGDVRIVATDTGLQAFRDPAEPAS